MLAELSIRMASEMVGERVHVASERNVGWAVKLGDV